MGSTARQIATASCSRNHPHIHGEYRARDIVKRWMLESSPYTWGVHSGPIAAANAAGIIPIYMGSTLYNEFKIDFV